MSAAIFVFDVESIGLHGEAFAVAGGIYTREAGQVERFCYAIARSSARGADADRVWVNQEVPEIPVTHSDGRAMRDAFWDKWLSAKERGCFMVVNCLWPVEANFLSACVADDPVARAWEGPYPCLDVATLLRLRGLDPTKPQPRLPNPDPDKGEVRAHHPLDDANQAARLWFEHLTQTEF